MELTKHVTQDDMTKYSGEGNIHSDAEIARRTGLERPVAQGMMTLAYASELMTKICGPAWLERGEIEAKFIGLVYPEDTITVRSADLPGGGYEVWAENQSQDTVMVARTRLR